MLIVQKFTEQAICETIDNLLIEEEFAFVFFNEESTIISSKGGNPLFKRFNRSL